MNRAAAVRYFAALAIVAVLAASWHWRLPPLYGLALTVDDFKYAFQPHEPPSEVVFVAVDEASVNQVGRWPWDREVLAKGLARLEPAQTVILDMVFSETSEPRGDRKLAGALGQLDGTVCGFFLRERATEVLSESQRRSLAASTLERIPAGPLPFPELPFAEINIPQLLDACTLQATFSTLVDADGLYRHYPIGFVYNDGVYPSLAVQALRLYHQQDFRITAEDGFVGQIADQEVAIDDRGTVPQNFYNAGAIPTISFVDLLNDDVPTEAIAGKVVIVGITEAGLADIRSTPIGTQPGPILHATFLANALGGHILRPAPTWGWVLLAVLGLLPPLATHLADQRQRRRWLAYGVAAGALVVGVVLAYRQADLWLPVFFPLLGLLLSVGAAEGLLFWERERQARFIRQAFGAYLSPDLVAKLAANPELLKLGGETRAISVLFSDIRSFTTLSESLDPEALVSLLNRYFTPVTRRIQAEGGYIDKFIGDAVMALFNAPVALPDHPDAACRAAWGMLRALEAFNREQRATGGPELHIGIGIHTGEAVVGNMGAEERLNYTALGDSVNVASRLEGLTKEYGRTILITGETHDRLQGGWATTFLGNVAVKGRDEPVRLFALQPPQPSESGER